jgi:DNA-binding transcriptional LysR family regulator
LLSAAEAGLGIAYLPSFLYADSLDAGLIAPALDDLPSEKQGIYAVYPPGRYTQPKLRAFIDYLVEYFKSRGPETW